MASARDSMETVSKEDAGVKLISLSGREDPKRHALDKALRKTGQYASL